VIIMFDNLFLGDDFMKKLLISFFLMSTLVANASSGTAKSSFSINASVISDPISVSASNVDFGLVNRGDTAFSSSDILVDGDDGATYNMALSYSGHPLTSNDVIRSEGYY